MCSPIIIRCQVRRMLLATAGYCRWLLPLVTAGCSVLVATGQQPPPTIRGDGGLSCGIELGHACAGRVDQPMWEVYQPDE